MGMLCPVSSYAFASNLQMPLNQQKEEIDGSNYFMISLHENYIAKLGFKLVNPESVVVGWCEGVVAYVTGASN